MGVRIKLIPARMQNLWTDMTREGQRLQDAANALARVASSLEMDVAARAGINDALASLQRQLKQQSANMQLMQQLAQAAAAEMDDKDAALANEAKGLIYDLRQAAGSASLYAGMLGMVRPEWNGTRGGLNLSAMANVDMLSNMTALLNIPEGAPLEPLNGVSLSSIMQQNLNDSRMTDAFISSCMGNPIYQLAGLGVAGASNAGMAAITKPKTGSSKKTGKKTVATPKQEAGFFQWGKDAVEKIGSKVSKGAEELQKKTKEAKKWAEEKLDEGWQTVKEFANNKQVKKYVDLYGTSWKYNLEAAGDILAIGGDILGLATSAGNPADMASDTYSLVNDCFVFYQDGEALLQLAFGNFHMMLGNEEQAEYWHTEAQLASEREGLADEFRAGGFDEIAVIVDTIDGINTAYKTVTGFQKVVTGAEAIGKEFFENKDIKAGLEGIFEQTGWKIPEKLEEGATFLEQLAQQKDVVGNIGLGYKYFDGLLNGEFIETILTNTGLGKPVGKLASADESFEEFWDRLMELSEKYSKK